MTEKEFVEFKNSYVGIFSTNYLFQGISNSLFAVIVPIYILLLFSEKGRGINSSELAFLASIVMLPWAIKLFFGILGDKYGSKKLGRRRPWIIGSAVLSGVLWIFIPFFITIENAILLFTIAGVFINVGVAFGDTILDGLILDICPKKQLGRTQGFCWGFKSIGAIAGGPVLAFIVVSIRIINVESIFIIYGILTIISSLLTLLVNEPKEYPEVMIKKHVKAMFTQSKDWKAYFFALFNAVADGVVMLFLSIYILIQMNLINLKGTSISLEKTDLNIYLYQANITLIVSVGIIIGAILGGAISDLISRKIGVYLSLIVTTIALLLILVDTEIIILLIFAGIIGVGLGWRHSSYSAVVGEMSKQHPEMDSTYFSICNSFANLGNSIGLAITGIIFVLTGGSYAFIFFFIAMIQNLGVIPFLLLEPKDYEFKITKAETIRDIK
jgi:MFS family permease